MKQIRLKTFETNSSSTHSISFRFKKQQVPIDKLEISGDTVVIHGISQSDLYPLVAGERSKLDYIFTWMYIRDSLDVEGDNEDPSENLVSRYWENYDNPEVREVIENTILWWPQEDGKEPLPTGQYDFEYHNILSAVQRKYPEVKRICLEHAWNCEFDHQTGPWEEDSIVDLSDTNKIYNYIFNDHLIVEIGHD